jgi:ABC-2 type transport system ATP-binding protein
MDKSIIVDHLVKEFEVTKRESGLRGAIKNIFSPSTSLVRALKGVSFTIQRGELVGFIGPNGAGKTTTLKTLSGLLYPTSGFVSVLGYDPWDRKPEYLKKISLVMGQKNQLWWDLPSLDTFELNKVLYEIPTRVYDESLRELTSLLKVEKYLTTPVRKLSLGQRMKMELIAALLHKPEILFLDEPTIGLDLTAQQILRDFIFEYNRKYQATIILTSHNMDDLIDLTRRVIVIDDGKILFDGLLEDLVSKFAKEKIIKAMLSDGSNLEGLEKIGKVKRINFPQVTISVARPAIAAAAAELLQNYPITDLTIEETPIEDVIRRVFKDGTKIKTSKHRR